MRPLRSACAVLLAALVVPLGASADRESAAGSSQAPASILYVGDSLGVGTSPALRSMLPRAPMVADARVGRTSSEGLAVLRAKLRRSQRVVVFDLGTNDWSATTLAANLRAAHAHVGRRLMIVFTMNKPGVAPLNGMVRQFASSARNVLLIDWHASAHSGRLLAGDGIHPTYAGYSRRAGLIVDRLRGLRRGGTASVDQDSAPPPWARPARGGGRL